MDDALAVGLGERSCHLDDEIDSAQRRHRSELRELHVERAATHILHDDERPVVPSAEVEHPNDAFARHVSQRARLASQALASAVVAGAIPAQHLERDATPERHVAGGVDEAHAATTHAALDHVAPGDDRATRQCLYPHA